nr:unnamed protein product [Callosobruchus analis]
MTYFTVAHLNVRSLLPKFTSFKDQFAENKFNCIALSETWLNSSTDSSEVTLNGYKLFRSDRDGRGGGVACFLKKDIKCSILKASNDEFDQL